MSDKPCYPIRVQWTEDGETWCLENEKDVCRELEWFDSTKERDAAVVIDASGRRVRLIVEALEIKTCEIETE